ncbi:glycosyltransferase family 4 protein [Campylobacter mucosalis]|uniref:glycosyltransferase family 4 protein n=1 Tax=Campylobacter mucosalis TaxID=202 RepID=UPI0014707CCD|nr:glycosyltransferase family 4 protein [Campylobacter mucosalis]
MRILFLTDTFMPEATAPAIRTLEHAKEWQKQKDVKVTIITCVPNYPAGKVFDGYKNKFYQKEIIDGIEVIRVWSYMAPNSGFLKRVLDFISFAIMAFFVGLFQKFDIVIATSPQFFTTWAGFALSKIKRKPWIFEVRDLWPESIKAVGAIKNNLAIKFLEKIELGLYKSSDKIVVVSDAFKDNLIFRGINGDKIDVVTNGSNLDLFKPQEKNEKLLNDLKLQNKLVVGYIGTHGMAHGLDFIIKALKNIQDDRVHFLFVGDGAVKSDIVKLAEVLRLTNITFLNPVNKIEVPKYLSLCDISLVPLRNNETFNSVIPSKIFESSAMQIPILLGVCGQARLIIEKYNAGIYFEPENQDDFLLKLNLLISDKNLYKNCQNGCLALANDFDRKVLANKMLCVIRNIVGL